MLIPKKTKHRKVHEGRLRGVATSGTTLAFGHLGLKALGNCWISSRQIEAARRVIAKYTRRGGKVWIRVFPDKPITRKGEQAAMGKGKGAVDHYVVVVKPGMVLFELDGLEESVAREALRLAAYKLPVKAKVITR